MADLASFDREISRMIAKGDTRAVISLSVRRVKATAFDPREPKRD